MAADRGRFLSGTRPEMNQYPKKYLCAKFGDFIPICMIFPLAAGLVAPLRESLPQLPFFLQASRLETIRCLLRARQFSEEAISCLAFAQRRGTIDSYQSKWFVY
jgi:hypothetical protein